MNYFLKKTKERDKERKSAI